MTVPIYGGRPSKLTPERAELIVGMVAKGMPLSTAAAKAGVGESTFFHWLAQGEHPKGRNARMYAEFRDRVYRAVKEAEGSAVEAIESAWRGGYVTARRRLKDGSVEESYAKPDWSAAAWYLERRHRDQWGKVDVVNVRLLAEHVAEQEGLTPAEREELERELAAILGTK